MSYTNGLDKPSDYFETVIYTGNGGTQSITSLDFQPDLVWLKSRSNGNIHNLNDSVRGVNKQIHSNLADAESTLTTVLTAFNSNGFTLGSESDVNGSGRTFVSWNWKAGTTTGIAGSPSVTPLGYSFNATSGFSAIKYEGTGSAATLPHGLGVAPDMIIVKALETSENWAVYHKSLGATKYIELNLTAGEATSGIMWNNTEPTSTLFTVNTNGGVNTNGNNYIAYCFADVQGYSQFGSYIGNGSDDGTFVYTGFKVGWLMVKRSSAAGDNWIMWDNKRNPFNVTENKLEANDAGAEGVGSGSNKVDFLSNGFKLKINHAGTNGSGSTYIYMAFAENPLITSTGIPATAR